MPFEEIHLPVLYGLATILAAGTAFLWIRLRSQSQRTQEMLHELGSTYEGQWRMWESRQKEMELLTANLTLAREQHDQLLRRSAGNRSERKEIMASLRAGARPDAIAAKLEMPRNEVRLLAKVQGILAASSTRIPH